jgi:hypothetical protein
MLIRIGSERDPGMPEELREYVSASHGKRRTLSLTHDQAARAAYIVAARRPCYICTVNKPSMIGKLYVERMGKWLVYGVCDSCKHGHSVDQLKHIAKYLFDEDMAQGIMDARPTLYEERGI